MGTVSSIPIKNTRQLFLLRLEPPDRTGLVLHNLSELERWVLEVHENGTLVNAFKETFQPGGILDVADVDSPALPAGLHAQAQRMVSKEYETWDELTRIDRLHLQISWGEDMLIRAEADFIFAVGLPHEENRLGNWNVAALYCLLDRIQHYTAHLDGLYTALQAM